MRKINLALAIHNHQPIDNDSPIVEQVYRTAYLPFLETLSKFPSVKANLHYTGYLLEWLEANHPEFIRLLSEMISRGQVEMLGGGYYEPILACIPDEDAKGQIEMLRSKIASVFSADAKGLWTAERAWEPQASEILRDCRVDFTLLDDTIFHLSGVSEDGCYRPYIVESRGRQVSVLPMLKSLRYSIPWKRHRETLSILRRAADRDGERLAVFGDDGEKFGAWPTTYEKVYKNGWLDGFFRALVENENWIITRRISDYLAEHPARDLTYLPSASYDEMMAWSLPAMSKAEGVRSTGTSKSRRGFWRLFLSKYPESGRMYAKMLSVSRMSRRTEDEDARREALRELWGGQCNDAYWHGVFGGLYSATLRRITYHHLLRAQSKVELALHGENEGESGWIDTSERVVNGHKELVVDTPSMGVSISPDLGGAVTEFDVKDVATNLLDTLQRRVETYHAAIRKSKKSGGHGSVAPTARSGKKKKKKKKERSTHDATDTALDALLVYDRLPKFSFLDYFLESRTDAADLLDQSYREKAPLAGRNYVLEIQPRTDTLVAQLSRNCSTSDGKARVSLRKRLSIPRRGSSIQSDYDFRIEPNEGRGEGILAIETNLSSLGDAQFIKANSEPRTLEGKSSYRLQYPQLGFDVLLELSEPSGIWVVPVKTVSRSEAGYESNLQGISVVPYFKIREEGRYGFSMRMQYLPRDTEES